MTAALVGWRVYEPGRNPELDRIVSRRFGRDHEKPCHRPTVRTCAFWECQVADACQALIAKEAKL